MAAGKKKASDPFARKDWYDIKAPTSFSVRQVGKTLVTRTTGTKVRRQAQQQLHFQEGDGYREVVINSSNSGAQTLTAECAHLEPLADRL